MFRSLKNALSTEVSRQTFVHTTNSNEGLSNIFENVSYHRGDRYVN